MELQDRVSACKGKLSLDTEAAHVARKVITVTVMPSLCDALQLPDHVYSILL